MFARRRCCRFSSFGSSSWKRNVYHTTVAPYWPKIDILTICNRASLRFVNSECGGVSQWILETRSRCLCANSHKNARVLASCHSKIALVRFYEIKQNYICVPINSSSFRRANGRTSTVWKHLIAHDSDFQEEWLSFQVSKLDQNVLACDPTR